MPKKIENIKENLIVCAKQQLLENGYDAFTMRSVARGCGVAVGTLYNYFPSKEMLAGEVMLKDWQSTVEKMKADCSGNCGIEAALGAMRAGVAAFSEIYRPVWAGYSFSQSAKYSYENRHELLVMQLSECIRPALERTGSDNVSELAIFLAENTLLFNENRLLGFDAFVRIALGAVESSATRQTPRKTT